MNPVPATPPAVAEINRLHEEAKRCTYASRQALHGALVAAWQAGHLLVEERKRVFRNMGPGAWLLWLKANFRGTVRTAQRYIRLAQCVTDAAFLQGMSLRQAYARLGIATEPKTPGKRRLRHTLPAHIVLANRLLRTLKRRPGQTGAEQGEAYRRDLRALFESSAHGLNPRLCRHRRRTFSPRSVLISHDRRRLSVVRPSLGTPEPRLSAASGEHVPSVSRFADMADG